MLAAVFAGGLIAASAGAPAGAGSASPVSPAVVGPRADTASPIVVLLHGLGRSHRSMRPLESALERAGYRVVNLGYPSRDRPVHELVDSVAVELNLCCPQAEGPVHFVTHSLGGILVRAYQAAHGPERIGRVVMLSPPNRGSEVVDRIPDALLELVLGPAALELGTDSGAVVHELPPPAFELGIITGNSTLNPLFSWWLPGEDDGKVAVESARVEGAEDFLVVPYSHAWIMRREEVIDQVLMFLETGAFEEPARAPAR